jgi:hypothetical protein
MPKDAVATQATTGPLSQWWVLQRLLEPAAQRPMSSLVSYTVAPPLSACQSPLRPGRSGDASGLKQLVHPSSDRYVRCEEERTDCFSAESPSTGRVSAPAHRRTESFLEDKNVSPTPQDVTFPVVLLAFCRNTPQDDPVAIYHPTAMPQPNGPAFPNCPPGPPMRATIDIRFS